MSDATTGPPVRPADDGRLRRWGWRTATRASHALARPTAALRTDPDYLIVGAQRAGTTSLHRYLLDSPSVLPARLTKGVHWLDTHPERSAAWNRTHYPLRAHVALRRRRVGGRVVTGEGSPYYMFHPAVPGRIAERLPGARLLVVLRDPVTRAWSQYHHERARGFEDLDVADALAAEPTRLEGEEARLLADPAHHSHAHRHHSYVARGRYLPQLERLWDAVGEDRVLVVESGELDADPQGVVDRVAGFLGIAPFTLTRPARHNARRYTPPDPDVTRWLAEQFQAGNEQLFDRLGRRWDWTTP